MTDPAAPPMPNPIAELLTTYNALNSSIDELTEIPSPLEFMRYVSRNRPFVVRGGANDWKATQTWSVDVLKERMAGMGVNVAVTPKGNADAPVESEDGEILFVKPWEEEQDFEEFMDFVIQQEGSGEMNGEVRYAQTQNDNLRAEYSALFTDVASSIPFARIALQKPPEAINLWIGNSASVTALHKDNYENIYVQIIGQKHFVLLPPLAYACVNEQELRPASYVREGGELVAKREDGDRVPFALWDPDGLGVGTRYSGLARPVRVNLGKGDMLYLPALWHDMEFGGSFYPLCGFARNVALNTFVD
ncbi:JmjC domain-containing protein [Lachnellula hyalina]|uniref:JmjC domain-containing protein n=1 Tax=Lachnellula hyalina TaxID=1316788 RepID=A0A8H8R021_9HELO|nr:JmjC domain-containing protein [Lachnellula hyalina]TVY24930.1 JmjC domain-containing protein [Lachnellula hyalina]